MKQIVYLSFLIFLVLGCEKEEINSTTEENSILTVKWKRFHSEVSNEKDNSMVYIYDSEEEYKSQKGNPIYSASLANISPVGGGTITTVNSATFYNLRPIKYWIKIFTTDSYHKMIEHNQDLSYTLQNPLINNTTTTVTVPTEKIFVDSYTINKIEIHEFPYWMNLEIGDEIQVKIVNRDDYGYVVILDSETKIINDSYISYEPNAVTIGRYTLWRDYYIVISKESASDAYYGMSIFELLNSSGYFGDEYIKYSSMGGIKYKINITWNY